MSDAPRWPGADGSPGLDFGSGPNSEFSDPSRLRSQAIDPASDPDATRQVSLPRPDASASDKPAGRTQAPGVTPKPVGPGSASSNRRSQNADDWQLDSITRAGGTAANASAASALGSGSQVPGFVAEKAVKVEKVSPSRDEPAARASRPARRTRKARLRINRIDPWSVMKTSFLFSIAFGVMTVAAVAVLWSVFAGSDSLTYINTLVNSVIADPQGENKFDIKQFLSWQRVIGLATVLAAVDVIIFTAVATLFGFLYNLASIVMGGLEITLAED